MNIFLYLCCMVNSGRGDVACPTRNDLTQTTLHLRYTNSI